MLRSKRDIRLLAVRGGLPERAARKDKAIRIQEFLRKYGAERYGKPLIPAGVLYVPSRSDMERVDPGESPAGIQALRQ